MCDVNFLVKKLLYGFSIVNEGYAHNRNVLINSAVKVPGSFNFSALFNTYKL